MSDRARQVLSLEPAANDPEVGRWLAALEDARRDTIRELATVTAPMVDWQPPFLLESIGSLLYHVALIEASWLWDEILAGEAPPAWLDVALPARDRDATGRLTRVEGEPLEVHLARLERIRQDLIDRLRPMSNADFHALRHLEPYDVAPDWVLHHLLQHEAEHRSHVAWVRDWYLATMAGDDQPDAAASPSGPGSP